MRSLFPIVLFLVGVPAAAAEHPNVVFILADDLGINDLSCYGRKDQRTPNLDKLAEQGIRLSSSYCAQPICSPSRAAIMTGKTPARLHLTTFLPGRPDAASQKLLHPKINLQLPLTEKTLAERFRAAGYATACIGKWHLGETGPFAPKERGFDFVHAGKANTVPTLEEGGKGEFDLTAKSIEFIEANRSKPFFLYLPQNNPHIPYTERADKIKKYEKSFNPTYAAVIEALDESVGRILAKLDELKLADNTIVIFTSDNGGLHVPELGLAPPTHNTPFRAGKGFVYEGGLRVPLVARFPGKFPAGKVIEAPFVNTEWTNTLLDLCGLPTDPSLDGASRAELLKGGPTPDRTLYWHFPHYCNQGGKPSGAVREGNWKYVEDYDTGRRELYDLATDPGEANDLAQAKPEIVTALAAKLDAWRKSVDAQTNAPNPKFDEKAYRQLYVDVNVSKLKPAATAAEMLPGLKPWRTLMDQVVQQARGDASKKKAATKKKKAG